MTPYGRLPAAALHAALLLSVSALPGLAQRGGAVSHVTVINPETGQRLADRTVVWREGRITAVGRAGRVRIPAGMQVLNARGMYLIPGLWDMHAHVVQSTDTAVQGRIFRTLVANGVTGVRDMGSFLDTLVAVRRLISTGRIQFHPRLVAAGPLLDGPRFRWSQAIAWHVTSAEEGREAVDSLKRAGVDFVKVYTSLPRAAFLAIVDQAKRQGLPVAGHIPTSVSAVDASTVGQVSFEHNGMWVYDGCVSDATTRINNALARWTREGFAAWYAERRAFHAARNVAACASVYETFRRNGTWMVPTIVNELKDGRALAREAYTHLDSASAKACENTVQTIEAVPDTLRTGFYADFLREIGELHRAGIPILAGTDLPNPCLAPGFSLHDELEELTAAGLSNAQALAAATVGPARFFGAQDSLGTVAVRHVADLVLLEADPLLNIRNTKRIRAVVQSGRLFNRRELDAFVAETRRRP